VFNGSFAEDLESPGRVAHSNASVLLENARRHLQNVVNEIEGVTSEQIFADSPFAQAGDVFPRAADVGDIDPLAMAEMRLRTSPADRRGRIGRVSAADLRAVYGVPDDVDLTMADFQALWRLEASGVDRSTIASVYIACDRNEAMAQNCLMAMG
jgi:hypothetical protein